jgi:hypothetical protein
LRITIEFDDERGTHATLTMSPSWLGRLFGRHRRVARIALGITNDWRFVDGVWVGSVLEARIKYERRWQTVGELPSARALKTEGQS